MRSVFLHVFTASLLIATASTRASASGEADAARLHSPEQLRQDLAVIGKTMKDSHPDISFSVAPVELDAAMHRISGELDHAMTRDEAWRVFATLNPLLADAHTGVFFPEWRKDAQTHLAQGGAFFPYEVVATVDGKLTILSALGGGKSPMSGARILSIDGTNAGTVVADLISRVHGDTPDFRAGLLSRRFWFFYWKMHGSPASFDLKLEARGQKTVRAPASHSPPIELVRRSDFKQAFRFETLPCDGAVLGIDTFQWSDKKKFLDFTRNAFATIKAKGVKTLIIDIRQNEGGDDDMWLQGIMPYIATRPYRWASGYKKRVMQADPAKGEKVGDVVSGSLDRWLDPDPANPLRFTGKAYLLTGAATYSSSILFANTMREFGSAAIAGERGIVRADQSGGTQDTFLPNTGLDVGWPRFILYRPSGQRKPELLEPDIVVADDPFHPRAAIDQLLRCSGR